MINSYQAGNMAVDQVDILRKRLLGRIGVFNKALFVARRFGVQEEEIPQEFTAEVRRIGREYGANSQTLHLFNLDERRYSLSRSCWPITARILGFILSQREIPPDVFDTFIEQNMQELQLM